MNSVTSVVFGGLGGQGVITASDILAEATFLAGFDVKKSDIHGMAQRGGSVSSDVRFGNRIFSPMVPVAEADFVVVLDESRVEEFRFRARPSGSILSPSTLGAFQPENRRATNVALIALLTARLGLAQSCVEAALIRCLKPAAHELSLGVFRRLSETLTSASGTWPEVATPPQCQICDR